MPDRYKRIVQGNLKKSSEKGASVSFSEIYWNKEKKLTQLRFFYSVNTGRTVFY